VIHTNALRGGFQRLALCLRQAVERSGERGLRQFKLGHGGNGAFIKPPRVVEHGGITLASHPRNDFRDRALDVGIGRLIESQQRIKRRQKIRRTRG
jgi:hypothetical protein